MSTGLDGRSVLVTGAAGGIGAACARRLAREGGRLVLADVDGGAQPDRRFGRLDVLFNNAGVIRVQPLLDVTEDEWDRVLGVNLRAVFFVLQAAARRMLRQEPLPGSALRGKLIQTASIAAYRGGNPLLAPYSGSKGGAGSGTPSAPPA